MASTRAVERFSAIMPCYNAGRWIREAVESALAQRHPLHELIVVDDGSTDDTLAILAAIADPRVRVLRANHGGASRARNLGLQHATGDFICFLDADDRWLPGKLEADARVFRDEPGVGAVFTNFQRFDEQGVYPLDQFAFYRELAALPTRPAAGGGGRVILGDSFCRLVAFGQLPGWTGATTFRAETVAGLRFDEALRTNQDLTYCFSAFLRADVAYTSEPLVQVRRHDSNATRDVDELPLAITRALAAIPTAGMSRPRRRALGRRIARQHIALAVVAARGGKVGEVYRNFAAALRAGGLNPSFAKQLLLAPAYLSRHWLQRRRAT